MHKEIIEISKLQFQKALDTLKFIPTYIDIGDINGAVNRTYYSVFYAIKSIELLDGFDSKKHSGVIAYFRQAYIKTGKFDVKYSDVIGNLFETRQMVDYNLVAPLTLSDASEFYDGAVDFIRQVEKYLDCVYKLN